MLKEQALRHQMVLPAQQAVYDYWRSKCQGGQLPSRHDIDPMQLKTHLPMVSLTSICGASGRTRFQYRLVGTGFWDLYNDEVQGRYIDELPMGDRCQYWNRVLNQVLGKGRPSAGVTRPGTPFGNHLAQFWIRLPLSDNGRDVNLILGYDHLIKVSDIPKLQAAESRLSA